MSKAHICCLLFCIALFSCSKDPEIGDTKYSYFKNSFCNEYNDSVLTIETYNIQLGFTAAQDPWNKDQTGGSAKQIHDLANVIRTKNPQIVLLQEVPYNRSNVEIKHFIEALADSVEMNYAFGEHSKNDAKWVWPIHGVWGNAILSKFPINEIENIQVSRKNRWEKRSVLRASIKFNPGLDVNVYALHHTGADDTEIENTRRFIERSSIPVIAGGDFNRPFSELPLNAIGLRDVFENKIPGIDRIYTSFTDTIYLRGVVPGSMGVSDHSAFYTRIKVK